MVTRKARTGAKTRRTAASKAPSTKADANVVKRPFSDLLIDLMKVYSSEVNLERAIPDYRDGMKPVSRKLCYVGSNVCRDTKTKSAKVIGELMGSYHPHGDCLRGDTVIPILGEGRTTIKELVESKTGPRLVLSYDARQRKMVVDVAFNWRVGKTTRHLYRVHLSNGEVIECTGNHPFHTMHAGWVKARDLRPSQGLKTGYIFPTKTGQHLPSAVFEGRRLSIEDTTVTDLGSIYDLKLTVARVEKVLLDEPETFYDFTTRLYSNMVVMTSKSLNDSEEKPVFVVVHNSGSYSALVTMVANAVPEFEGIGNWGTPVDPPAAHRYTETHLSHFGRSFFAPNYIAKDVTPFVPNYDRTTTEPLVLPSLLPSILFNGSQGIGVGLRTAIPSFTPQSVLQMMIRVLTEKGLTANDYAKTLKLFEPWGALPVKSKANQAKLVELMEGPKGSIDFMSGIDVDRDSKSIRLHSFAPGIRIESLVVKLRGLDQVTSVTPSDNLSFVVDVRKTLNYVEFDKLVERITKMLKATQHYHIIVTERLPVEGSEIGEYTVNFLELSIPKLMHIWLKWRIGLEVSSLQYQIKVTEAAIRRTKLLIFACNNLDVIFKALKTTDPEAYLMKHLKLSKEDVNTILELKVRQLSRLDFEKLKAQLADQQKYLKGLQAKLKRPRAQVLKFLEACVGKFELQRAEMGQQHWKLLKI